MTVDSCSQRSCDVPEEPRSKLEILDGDPLVRRVDELRRHLRIMVRIGKNP